MKGWRFLRVAGASGAENMARDVALMERARLTGEAVFSIYDWGRPTLSLGRNQPAKGRYDLAELESRGIDIVRRPTGGRALLHWHEATYSVTGPIAENESLADSYERINRILLRGLETLGAPAREFRGGPRTPSPGELPCFAAPAEGELVLGAEKLVGSAQIRENGAFLQHGSILIEDDQPIIASLLLSKDNEMQPAKAATLSEALGRQPQVAEVADAMFEAVRKIEDPQAMPMDAEEIAEITAKYLPDYQNELWTWRR